MRSPVELSSLLERLTPDPEKNIKAIVRLAGEFTPKSSVAYKRFDERRGFVQTFAGYRLPKGYIKEMSTNGALCFDTTCANPNRPVFVKDALATSYAATDPNVKKFRIRSYLAVPVRLGSNVCGALCAIRFNNHPFSPKESDTLSVFGKLLCLEEQRARYRSALKRRLAWEKMLLDISSKAVGITNVSKFIDSVIERMRKTIDVEGIFFWKYDDTTDTISVASEWIIKGHKSQKDNLQNIPISVFPWGMGLMRQNKIMEFEDISDVPGGQEKEIMRAMGVKSILMIPLFVNKSFYGTFGFEVYSYYRKWADEDIYVLRTVSQIITRAIEQYRADEAIKRANKDLEKKVSQRTSRLRKTIRELEVKQRELTRYKARLEKLNKTLLETNAALRVLARNIEKRQVDEKKKLSQLISRTVLPVLSGLQMEKMPSEIKSKVDILVSEVATFARYLEEGKGISGILTTAELRVASLIRDGYNTRQIAQQLHISEDTVKTHRRKIRKKLGLVNQQANLASYLRSGWEAK